MMLARISDPDIVNHLSLARCNLYRLREFRQSIEGFLGAQGFIQNIYMHPENQTDLFDFDKVDFFNMSTGMVVMVTKAQYGDVLSMCDRICRYKSVKSLVVLSARFVRSPDIYRGKRIHIIHVARAM